MRKFTQESYIHLRGNSLGNDMNSPHPSELWIKYLEFYLLEILFIQKEMVRVILSGKKTVILPFLSKRLGFRKTFGSKNFA